MGVEIWLENLSNYTKYRPFHYIFTNLKEFRYVLDRVKDVQFVLDIGHANIGNSDPFEGLGAYSDRIVGMSFSNNEGEKDTHFPLSHGTVDFKKLVHQITDLQWKGLIAFETRGRDPDQSMADLQKIYETCLAERTGPSVFKGNNQ